MLKIETSQGAIDLITPSHDFINVLGKSLPLGLLSLPQKVNGAQYGIVMKKGNLEASLIKQQPPDISEEHIQSVSFSNFMLITMSLSKYLNKGFGGCLMPCLYKKNKARGVEVGIAYLGTPSESGIEALSFPFNGAFDNQFGHGFTTMFTSFIEALKESANQSGMTLQPCIGLDCRETSTLGNIGLGFLVSGSSLLYLRPHVSQEDPMWNVLRSIGIDRIFHLPSIPVNIGSGEQSKERDIKD